MNPISKVNIIFFVFVLMASMETSAETVKIVQWWGEYIPQRYEQTVNPYYRSSLPDSLQFLDLDANGEYNDSLVWYPFSIAEPLNLNPLPHDPLNPKTWMGYRIDRFSARFYGGMLARFTNVSHFTKTDYSGNTIPYFNRFQQSTVQNDGATPCSYLTDWPQNIIRGLHRTDYEGPYWSDMTLMVVNCCSAEFSLLFQDTPDAEVNFTAIFLWKKADFLNGGDEAVGIQFDASSKLSVDITRFRLNIQEMRFVVVDGNQFWISEFAYPVTDMAPATIELSPPDSNWAIYEPSGSDAALVESLTTELNNMDYDPSGATPEQTAYYREKGEIVQSAVNNMTFDVDAASFSAHSFTDIQAVGVYFATYPFAHESTQIVFDNFQAYVSAEVPDIDAVAIDNDFNFDTIPYPRTQFSGGISKNGGPFERQVSACQLDSIRIVGEISITDSKDIGKMADIVAVAAYRTSLEATETETLFNITDRTGLKKIWDRNVETLTPVSSNVTLTSNQSVELFDAFPEIAGYYRIFFGYRLSDQTVVFNHRPFELIVDEMYVGPWNETTGW